MAYFKRDGGNRGGSSFGGNGSRRPGFGNKSWGNNDRRDGGQTTLYKATCANCGRQTEVPFRPIEGRAVYCKDCFGKTDAGERGRDRFPKKEFRSERPAGGSFRPDGNADLKRELETMNAKMDRLIKAVEAMAFPKAAEKPADAPKKPLPVAVKDERSLKEIVDKATEKAKPKAKKPAPKKKK